MNKIIPIDFYNTDFLFVIGTKDELKASLEKYIGKENAKEAYTIMTKNTNTVLGRFASLSNKQAVLWMLGNFDKGALAQGIFHITCNVMEKTGISLCDKSNDAYAYLMGFITNEVEDILPKKGGKE